MRRLLFTTAAVALLLAPAAASAKTGWETDLDWESLVPGQRTDVTLSRFNHDERAGLGGVVPTIVFTELTTGMEYRFRGSTADANGRSVVPVRVPSAGGYQVEVFVGDQIEGGWPPIHITSPPPPSTNDNRQTTNGGNPALWVGAALLAIAAAALVAARARPRLGGAG